MMSNWIKTLGALLLLVSLVHAQFQFFEQMFSGSGGQERKQASQNVPSDSSRYNSMWDGARCDKYLCPGTLACVHFPHHCPCPHPDVEEKFELGEGSAVCVSRGGYKAGEAARKVELARKGLI
ncbi:hypothetical protein P175DRAFT_0479549 [Aspergillus ochraceoroseus IBT 24754]|uniref:Long chronological lifespan protein 2 n=2 Tax=Aspergillus subgen. Nidulantes TaxID=2720870 RepID=A0A0F8WDI4_9EURO|nr:uncharacterized protein P175DRAFT_0479549 [Aspergillus ochraceoroseus IBT 24754]KKK15945.1 hypothetical protein ARAM_002797 [Aspergillus rambellii]PTU20997.1 hypothetical protein P175DRAFT_0479549 [Aspergillus ochraceoroseus IBT 24754]